MVDFLSGSQSQSPGLHAPDIPQYWDPTLSVMQILHPPPQSESWVQSLWRPSNLETGVAALRAVRRETRTRGENFMAALGDGRFEVWTRCV